MMSRPTPTLSDRLLGLAVGLFIATVFAIVRCG